jgi:adenylosuccinate lyase
MIDRYCTPAMTAIWSRQAKCDQWRRVEIEVCRAWMEEGVIPAEDFAEIEGRAGFTLERCDELEQETRHDLVAFVRALEESVGPAGRWIHLGVTSYDVIDTALGMMLSDSCAVLAESLEGLRTETARLALETADLPAIGRTHAIHAEPITFGFKAASWHAELGRAAARLAAGAEDCRVGKISGAVGIHAHVSPEMEARICDRLGLRADEVSTQIVNRDRLASLLCTLAVLAGGLERMATELRNLQRTEIREVEEEFKAGQTGSSAMPHKRNPWSSETVCGLARLVRGHAHAMLESIATWHERDLTNSSLERIILPDTFQLLDFMLRRMTSILRGLQVRGEAVRANLRLMGDLVFSEHLMAALVKKGLSRADAYKTAQRNAALAWDGQDFQTAVRSDSEVVERLSVQEIDEAFSLEHHLRHAGHSLKTAGITEDQR